MDFEHFIKNETETNKRHVIIENNSYDFSLNRTQPTTTTINKPTTSSLPIPQNKGHDKGYDDYKKKKEEILKQTKQQTELYKNNALLDPLFGSHWKGNLNNGIPIIGDDPLSYPEKVGYKSFVDLKNNIWDSGMHQKIMTVELSMEGPLNLFTKKIGHDLTDEDKFNLIYHPDKFDKYTDNNGINILGQDHRTIGKSIGDSFSEAGSTINDNVIQPVYNSLVKPLINDIKDPIEDMFNKIIKKVVYIGVGLITLDIILKNN
jgi:hypothetical protein